MIPKKFKIWCKGTSDNANFQKPHWIKNPHDCVLNKYFHFLDLCASPDFIVFQSTGLRDMCNVEIYEGDILLHAGYTAEVKYNEDAAGFMMQWRQSNTPRRQNYVMLTCDIACECQVVSHIVKPTNK
jgi:hypothetical protein